MNHQGKIASVVLKSLDQAADGLVSILVIEVFATQFVVLGGVTKHVVRGCKRRGGHCEDALLSATPCIDARELGSKVAVLDAQGGASAFPTSASSSPVARCKASTTMQVQFEHRAVVLRDA
jgi:hypothetical protein